MPHIKYVPGLMRAVLFALIAVTAFTKADAYEYRPACLHEGETGQKATGTLAFERFADPRNPTVFISGYKLILKHWDCYQFDKSNGNYQDADEELTEIALLGWESRSPSLKSLLGKSVNVTGKMQTVPGLSYIVIPQMVVETIEQCNDQARPVTPKCSDKRFLQ